MKTELVSENDNESFHGLEVLTIQNEYQACRVYLANNLTKRMVKCDSYASRSVYTCDIAMANNKQYSVFVLYDHELIAGISEAQIIDLAIVPYVKFDSYVARFLKGGGLIPTERFDARRNLKSLGKYQNLVKVLDNHVHAFGYDLQNVSRGMVYFPTRRTDEPTVIFKFDEIALGKALLITSTGLEIVPWQAADFSLNPRPFGVGNLEVDDEHYMQLILSRFAMAFSHGSITGK